MQKFGAGLSLFARSPAPNLTCFGPLGLCMVLLEL